MISSGADLSVFAVDDSCVQLSWRKASGGTQQLRCSGPDGVRTELVETDEGPGTMLLEELAASTVYEVMFLGTTLRCRTGEPPPGPELARFATISDLHLGQTTFGFFSTMTEQPTMGEPHPIRCARRALGDAVSWGATSLVIKGDATNGGRRDEWRALGELVSQVSAPIDVVLGNHDNRPNTGMGARTGLEIAGFDRQAGRTDRPRSIELDGLHLILANTSLEHRHLGRLAHVQDEVADLAADARNSGVGVLVIGHHFPMRAPIPHFWPPGVPSGEARRFFTTLARANPRAFYTAGHAHRHRRYERHGVLCTEVGSPKDYPGTWAGYTVYEEGIRQTVRRVGGLDVLAWTDYTRRAALGLWGLWSPGRLRDRCFLHRWSTRACTVAPS